MTPLRGFVDAMRKALHHNDRRSPTRSHRGGIRRAMAGMERLEDRELLAALGAASHQGAATDPAVIQALAADAYLWGLAPEFAQRFSTYNTTVGAPFNTLQYGSQPSAWNNAATNAGDASVLYINSFIDFSKTGALVLTVPPSADHYYVVAYLDSYLNTIGSIGTRTTPSDAPTSYLLVGPNSPHAKQRTVKIAGRTLPVLASDTNLNQMLIRVATNTLADASDPASVPSIEQNVLHQFALNPFGEFARNGYRPVFPTNFETPSPTPAQVAAAEPFKNTPTVATQFFDQLGASVRNNPIPLRFTGLSGSPLSQLPSWVVPQYNARLRYFVPSYGQSHTLRAFAPIGLTAHGFRIPKKWGPAQLQALQQGFETGQAGLMAFIHENNGGPSTNYWTILNTLIGTYPNNEVGYAFRAAIVLNGGFANIPADAVYPSVDTDQGKAALDGNNTYSITFKPPLTSDQSLVANGIFPPMVSDAQGNPKGFWSITLYQPDPTEVAAPYLSQASVLNTHYSSADTAVVSIDAATDVITVRAPSWGRIVESTPILFGSNAAEYGLQPNTVYYVASAPIQGVDPSTQGTTYSFMISRQWIQDLSNGNVPIQNSGGPGPIVDLQSPAGASPLAYGMVKPVSQLGSEQLAAGQLALNADGSLTLWFAPSLPAGVAASNWIPTPSTAYFNTLYPTKTVSTALQIILRMYYPTPGNTPPSILPYDDGRTRLPQTYIPPLVS